MSGRDRRKTHRSARPGGLTQTSLRCRDGLGRRTTRGRQAAPAPSSLRRHGRSARRTRPAGTGLRRPRRARCSWCETPALPHPAPRCWATESHGAGCIAPLMGNVHRRKRDDGAVERTLLAQVPTDRPEVLDEPGRRIRRRPPIEVEYRRAGGPADDAAQGRWSYRVLPSAHETRLRNCAVGSPCRPTLPSIGP